MFKVSNFNVLIPFRLLDCKSNIHLVSKVNSNSLSCDSSFVFIPSNLDILGHFMNTLWDIMNCLSRFNILLHHCKHNMRRSFNFLWSNVKLLSLFLWNSLRKKHLNQRFSIFLNWVCFKSWKMIFNHLMDFLSFILFRDVC